MIALAAQLLVAAAVLPGHVQARPVHWLDEIPARIGAKGCVPLGPTAWKCTGYVPLPESVAGAAASGTTSMGGGGRRHHHSRHFDGG
jgi:hypothetical protein